MEKQVLFNKTSKKKRKALQRTKKQTKIHETNESMTVWYQRIISNWNHIPGKSNTVITAAPGAHTELFNISKK